MRRVQHFIYNAFVDSVDGSTFPSVSPIDNEQVAEVAEGAREDAARAVEAARRAFDEGPWPRVSPAERKRILHRVADGNYMGQNYGKIISITDSEIKLREIVSDGQGGWSERVTTVTLNE